jgi:plastocyanin
MRHTRFLTLAVALTAAASLACSSSSSPSLATHDVRIVLDASTLGNAAFSPNPFSESFATRAKVIWVNGDESTNGYGTSGTTHHLVSDAPLFDSGNLAPGATFSFTFPAAGSYPYHCSIHPTMVGTITINP